MVSGELSAVKFAKHTYSICICNKLKPLYDTEELRGIVVLKFLKPLAFV